MGGSYSWVTAHNKTLVRHWTDPQSVSPYLPFIGKYEGQDHLNHLPYVLMVLLIVFPLPLMGMALGGLFLIKKPQKVLLHAFSFALGMVFFDLLAFIYVILFNIGDQTAPVFFNLMLALFLLELPVTILAIIHWFVLKRCANLPYKHYYNYWTQSTKKDDAVIDRIFRNVVLYKRKKKQTPRLQTEVTLGNSENAPQVNYAQQVRMSTVFFDLTLYQSFSRRNRYNYVKSRNREAVSRSYPLWLGMIIICVPSMLQQLVYSTYTFVDKLFAVSLAPHAYMNGQYTNSEILNAINLATRYGTIAILMTYAFAALIGASSLILFSYGYGRRNKAEMSKVFGNSLTTVFIISCLMVFLAFFVIKPFIFFQQTTPNTHTLAYKMGYWYVFILFMFTPLQFLTTVLVSLIRGEGKSGLAFFIIITSFLVNMLLNWIMLTYTNLGLNASAIATGLVYTLTAILSTIFIFTDKMSYIRCSSRDLWLDRVIFLNLIAFGLSTFVQTIALAVALLFQTHLVTHVATRTGDIFSENNGTISNGLIQLFAAMTPWRILLISPVNGFAVGTRAMLAYNYSARKMQRYNKINKYFIITVVTYGTIAYACIIGLAPQMISLFLKNGSDFPNINHYRWYFVASTIFVILLSVYLYVLGYYQAKAENLKSFLISSVRSWIILIPLLYLAWSFSWAIWADNRDVAVFFFIARSLADVLTALSYVPLIIKFQKESKPLNLGKELYSDLDQEIIAFTKQMKANRWSVRRFLKHFDPSFS